MAQMEADPPSLIVAAPPDPAQVPELVRSLRGHWGQWQRQLVPIVIALPGGYDQQAVDAYGNGVDFVVTPDVPPETLRARVRGLQRVHLLTSLLVDSRDRAQRRLESQSQAMRLLVEEAAEPVSVLKGGLETLGRVGASAEQQTVCHEMGYQLLRLAALGRDLHDFHQLTQNELHPQREAFDLTALFGTVVERFQPAALGRRVSLEVTKPLPAGVRVAADGPLVERALEDLIADALRWAAPGTPVHIEAASAGRTVSFTVLSQMPSLPVESRERLFEPTARLSGDLPPGVGGSGLAFCRAVMSAHGGNMHVTDRDGRTCVVAVLPR